MTGPFEERPVTGLPDHCLAASDPKETPVSDDQNTNAGPDERRRGGLLATLFLDLVRDAVKLVIALAAGLFLD